MLKSVNIKHIVPIIVFFLLAALILHTGMTTSAKSETIVLTPNGYWHFDAPKSVFATDDMVAVLDGSTLVSFSHEAQPAHPVTLEPGTNKALSHNGILIRISDTQIFVGNSSPLSIAATAAALGDNRLYAASGSDLYSIDLSFSEKVSSSTADGSISAISAYGSSVFVATENAGGTTTLTKYEDNEGSAIKIFDKSIDALACLSATEICYVSGADIKIYDIFSDDIIYSSSLNDFVTDIYAHKGVLYILTSAGDVLKLTGKSALSTIITSASDASGFYNSPASLTSRKDTLLVVDEGNNRIAITKNGRPSGSIRVYDTKDTALDYSGYIYIASSQSVKIYNAQLEPITSTKLLGNVHDIVSIAVDYSEPIKNSLYAVTADGKIANLTASPQISTDGDYVKVSLSANGGMYAMTAAGSIISLNKSDLSPTGTVVTCAGAVDFAVDAEGNIYAAYPDAVTKYSKAKGFTADGSCAVSGLIGGIDISMVDMPDSGIKYGDILVTDTQKNRIVKCDTLTASMNDTEADDDYYAEMTSGSGRTVDNESIIRSAVIENSDVYQKPVEMPAKYSVSAETKVIIIDDERYDDSGYWFVLVDMTGGGAVYGFMNKNVLSEPYAYGTESTNDVCVVLADNTAVKKYPSVSAETATYGNTGDRYSRLPFVSGYIDIYGNEWCRVTYGDNYEGYVLRGSVSIDGNVIIRPNDSISKPNARIKAVADETYVHTYLDELGQEKSEIILAIGAEVEVIGTFNRSYDYTQIKYSYSDGANIFTRTCYVPTANIYYEETTMYQVIAFVVIIVIILLVIVLIIIKKRKENILADKQPKF